MKSALDYINSWWYHIIKAQIALMAICAFQCLILSANCLHLQIFPPFCLGCLVVEVINKLSKVNDFFIKFVLPRNENNRFHRQIERTNSKITVLGTYERNNSKIAVKM